MTIPPEARLIDELRAGPAWLPALSLVAVTPAGEVIGHVLGTRGHVGQDPVVALGPLAVRPDQQRRGVGSALMHAVLGRDVTILSSTFNHRVDGQPICGVPLFQPSS